MSARQLIVLAVAALAAIAALFLLRSVGGDRTVPAETSIFERSNVAAIVNAA